MQNEHTRKKGARRREELEKKKLVLFFIQEFTLEIFIDPGPIKNRLVESWFINWCSN